MEIRPPAIPSIVDKRNGTVGLRVDTGVFRLAYFSFDLPIKAWAFFRPLFESSLFFLRQQTVRSVQLQVPGPAAVGRENVALLVDQALVEATVWGEVEKIHLVARSLPGYELLDRMAMQQTGREGDKRTFAVPFRPPRTGLYQLSLKLDLPEGRSLHAGRAALGLGIVEEEAVLVLLGEHHREEEKIRLGDTFASVFGAAGLRYSVVELSKEVVDLQGDLIDHFREEGDFVIWLANTMRRDTQSTFADFFGDGGKLLIASFNFTVSGMMNGFLGKWLHVVSVESTTEYEVRIPSSDGGNDRSFTTVHKTIDAAGIAESIMFDGEGQVVGVRVEDAYRFVYLPFDLKNLDGETQRTVLESQLDFLLPEQLTHLKLSQRDIFIHSSIPLQSWNPRVLVSNSGSKDSRAFQVGYQIARDGQVIASGVRDEVALEAHGLRPVQFPAWMPPAADGYKVSFGVDEAGDSLAYEAALHFEVVEVPPPFVEVELPGAVDKGNGVGFFDYDSDGDLDLCLVRRGAPSRLLRNDGGTFTEQTEAAGLRSTALDRGLAFGDYDGDGDLDLYLISEEDNLFFGNGGDGSFAEIAHRLVGDSTAVGLDDAGSGRSAGFFDGDRDGDLDLYLVNHGGVNRFYQNEGGLFVERAAEVGLADEGSGRGLALGDVDGDGAVDLFVANTSGGSRFYRNGGRDFAAIENEMGLNFEGGEVAAALGDVDGDGAVDLFVANERGANRLFRNEGDVFGELTGEALDLGGTSVGSTLWDYDNDGDLDLVTTALNSTSEGDEIYHHRGEQWISVGPLLALADSSVGRGMSAADFDGDGNLDLVVADNKRSRLYRNGGGSFHWLEVELEGSGLNRHGLGARVELVVGRRRFVEEVQSAFGYASQRPPRLHFGLGDLVRVDTLRVVWPNGQERVLVGVGADQKLEVTYQVPTAAAEISTLPQEMRLWPNYPNPFNSATVIRFVVPQAGEVELAIYNLMGQRVAVLVEEVLQAGAHSVIWNGRAGDGRVLASGVYLYRLRMGVREEMHKLLLIR